MLVRAFDELTPGQRASAGQKGSTLSRLYQAGYPVPPGFIILPAAFTAQGLTASAWAQVQTHLQRLRGREARVSFAVRSSALGEDSAQASFAGEFETVLDVYTDEEVHQAIQTVRQSWQGERARAYSQAQGATTLEMAVVVQRLVRADLAGVLFTADPLDASRPRMTGNFVHGLGDKLVSGEANPHTFVFQQGRYDGPPELGRQARQLYKLARRLEKELGGPQDIEWAVAQGKPFGQACPERSRRAHGKLFLLQSRPITTLAGHNPLNGEWNDSLTGDYLWSNGNLSEAISDVMTPSTWSIVQIYVPEITPIQIPDYPPVGNIAGRPYVNISLLATLVGMFGLNVRQLGDTFAGRIPAAITIPPVVFSRRSLLSMLPGMVKLPVSLIKYSRKVPEFVAASPGWCDEMSQRIQAARTGAELACLWRQTLEPQFRWCSRILGAVVLRLGKSSVDLQRKLTKLAGAADANALLSNLHAGDLASLGPLLGLCKVARGEMSRQEYVAQYGHRGAHELELSIPRPAKDPHWLEQELAQFASSGVDVEALLAKQRAEYDAAWRRFRASHPRQVRSTRRSIERVAQATRQREAVRSEAARIFRVMREFFLRAGTLTGLGDDAFFLSAPEMLALLSGGDAPVRSIPARREMHRRYNALPPYPALISGRFDPLQWAADPQRRSDFFDSHAPACAHAPAAAPASDAITGFAGAAGVVQGLVRRLDSPEQGAQLQTGEVLVTATTNVGWTLLFPRAAAIVTDVGAPLSHSAIVARELGIPAVVGCGNATARLRSGDLVRVNGGLGTVEVLD